MKIAIAGSGRASRRQVVDVLETAILEGGGQLLIAVPSDMDKESSSAPRYAADWAELNDVPFTLYVPAKGEFSSHVHYLMEVAEGTHAHANVSRDLGSEDRLYLAWDEEDERCMRMLVTARTNKTQVFDLTSGLERLVLDNEEDDDDYNYRGTPMVGGDREELEVYVDHREVMKKVQRILDRAMGDVQSILSEHIETSQSPRKTRRTTRTNA